MKISRNLKKVIRSRNFLKTVGLVAGLFILANLGIAMAYNGKLYPNSNLAGVALGSKDYQEIEKTNILPENIELKTTYNKQTIPLSKLAVKINWDATRANINKEKSWLPIFDYARFHQIGLVVDYDQDALKTVAKKASKDFAIKPTDWKISKKDSATISPGKLGKQVDQQMLEKLIAQSVTTTGQPVDVPLKDIQPAITQDKLEPLVEQLNNKSKVSISFSYKEKSKQASVSDILSWYTVDKANLKLSEEKVKAYLVGVGNGFGIGVKNIDQLTKDIATSLDKQVKLSATLIAAPKAVKKYTFCVRAKGVSSDLLPEFAAKFTSTLNTAKGWALNGQVSFTQVSSGCSFTAWLSKASLVPSFSPSICDSTWSCSVPPNVIINYDRWTGASPAWNKAGGSLNDYRDMVINHETGHWLGFRHRFCGGKGQAAPVMQQQSINLQGCKFNPWPTSAEKNTLKATLGL